MVKWTFETVRDHIREKHPGCPEAVTGRFAIEIAAKEWKGVTIGRAVGITMQNKLRHLMTEYDTLLLQGVERKAARKQVQPKILAMLGVWEKPPERALEGDENT